MKINNIENEQNNIMTITTRLNGIDKHIISKNDSDIEIIVLKTEAGNFSNYRSVWERQNIDSDTIDEGSLIELEYKIHKAKNDVEFKNFIRVKIKGWN